MKRVIFALLLCTAPYDVFAHDYIAMDRQYSAPDMKKPASAALSGASLAVADPGAAAVFVFDGEGKLSAKLASNVPGNELRSPVAVAAGRDGRFYVLDNDAGRVAVFDTAGKFLFSFGDKGDAPGRFLHPSAIAAGTDGRIYVADTGNSRIEIFSSDGILSMTVPLQGEAAALAVDASDNFYVAMRGGESVLKYGPDAKQLSSFKMSADGFCVDEYGYMYALDSASGKVREYSPQGDRAGEFGSLGRGQGQFVKPVALMCAPDGRVFVSDKGSARLFSFTISYKNRTARLPVPRELKLSLSGPQSAGMVAAGQFAPQGDGTTAAFLNTSKRLVLLDASGDIKKVLSAPEKKPEPVRRAGGMAWSDKTGLVVSDADSDRVVIFNSTGGVKAMLGEKAGFLGGSSHEGRFSAPTGVEINPQGEIFIADSGNSRVQEFNADGMFVSAIGPDMSGFTLLEPVDVCWAGDSLVILDRKLRQAVRVDPASGKVLARWGDAGDTAGQLSRPVSLTYDGHGFIYVLDAADARVKVFDLTGRWMAGFFSQGSGKGELLAPEKIRFSNGKLLVSDPKSLKLEEFALDIKPESPVSLSGEAKEDKADLAWSSRQSQFVTGYTVYRSTRTDDIGVQAGTATSAEFAETLEETPATYYYTVSARSFTGGESRLSEPYGLFVPGNPNVARVEVNNIDLAYIFSAEYKYYLRHPFGKITLANNSDTDFRDVKVSFGLRDFMDYPSDQVIPKMEAHSKTEVALSGTLNNHILEISEDTPVQAQISVTYYEKGQERSVNIDHPVKVLSRSAIIWDNAARLSTFVTPKDTPVLAFVRGTLNLKPASVSEALNPNIANAALLWSGLGELGMTYATDPSKPYEKIKSDAEHPLDNVQQPRDTLKLRSGKCSDLVALFSTMLESAGMHTAFIDYPGHIALMFDTGATAPEQLGLPADRLVFYEGTYWLPVEATMTGGTLADSSAEAARMYTHDSSDVKIIDTHKAWEDFEPMTLPASSWETVPADAEKVKSRFVAEAAALMTLREENLRREYAAALDKDPADADALIGLAMLCVDKGDFDGSAENFNRLLKVDAASAAALNGLGNISYLKGDYKAAADYYAKAAAADQQDGELVLNQARAALKLGDNAGAAAFAAKAAAIDSELEEEAAAFGGN
jgi:DNA-binding beta-propeller fold protein YncE